MKKEKSDYIAFKKKYIFYILIVIIVFLVGFFIGTIGFLKQRSSNFVENCKKFCEFIPNTEFSHINSDDHCYCIQREKLIDSIVNKTMVYTKLVDAGIITDVEIKDHLK